MPNLSYPDIYLWGILKDRGYADYPRTFAHLRDNTVPFQKSTRSTPTTSENTLKHEATG